VIKGSPGSGTKSVDPAIPQSWTHFVTGFWLRFRLWRGGPQEASKALVQCLSVNWALPVPLAAASRCTRSPAYWPIAANASRTSAPRLSRTHPWASMTYGCGHRESSAGSEGNRYSCSPWIFPPHICYFSFSIQLNSSNECIRALPRPYPILAIPNWPYMMPLEWPLVVPEDRNAFER
jgi:hypothetical protein